jgi:hypothetical protein
MVSSFMMIDDRILVIALLGQSLVMYDATKDSLMSATLPIWPDGINVSATIVVLSFHVVLLVIMLRIIPSKLTNNSRCGIYSRTKRSLQDVG